MNNEIKKALKTLQDLKGDVEYSINKARENQAHKIIGAWNKSKKDVREKDVETISNRLSVASRGINSSYGPTGMQIASLTKAKSLIIKLGEMIDNLSLKYNRQRQAMITKELIEIISGAESL